jgi:hypothetical protein
MSLNAKLIDLAQRAGMSPEEADADLASMWEYFDREYEAARAYEAAEAAKAENKTGRENHAH